MDKKQAHKAVWIGKPEKEVRRMKIYEMKKESYKKAEQISREVIEMCTKKEISLMELELIKTALPIAIDEEIMRKMYKTKLS